MNNDILNPTDTQDFNDNSISSLESSKQRELENFYQKTKDRLENLKQKEFIGVSEPDVTQETANCVVTMNSQYETTDLSIRPDFMKQAMQEAQIPNADNIEMYQLVPFCIAVGEAVKAAFNDAREKANLGSKEVFNELMGSMQNNLFPDQEDKA